jgi:hypothetical protein
MGHNFKAFRHNFNHYFNIFYDYFLRTLYWGSVPAIVLYGKIYNHYKRKTNSLYISLGLFSKPYSPLLLALWAQLTGVEES